MGESGSAKPTKKNKRLRPWHLAVMLIGEGIDVEHATDDQFQSFVDACAIPVDAQGIAEWSFDDKLGVIYHAMDQGMIEVKDNTLVKVEPAAAAS